MQPPILRKTLLLHKTSNLQTNLQHNEKNKDFTFDIRRQHHECRCTGSHRDTGARLHQEHRRNHRTAGSYDLRHGFVAQRMERAKVSLPRHDLHRPRFQSDIHAGRIQGKAEPHSRRDGDAAQRDRAEVHRSVQRAPQTLGIVYAGRGKPLHPHLRGSTRFLRAAARTQISSGHRVSPRPFGRKPCRCRGPLAVHAGNRKTLRSESKQSGGRTTRPHQIDMGSGKIPEGPL